MARLRSQASNDLDTLWDPLRRFTAARVGLPRSGASLRTPALLDFRLAHAQARDAVHAVLDMDALQEELAELGLPVLKSRSAAADRHTYLVRPDLGRQLQPASRAELQAQQGGHDLCIVIADGLSATAAQRHAGPLARALVPALRSQGWTLAPLVLLRHGRVATGDDIGQALRSRCVVVLIGERPGLSAPDSLGAYLTWGPRVGRLDAERNCVSNIRPAGLPSAQAAQKLAQLLGRMRTLGVSGVALKDDSRPELA